MLRAGDIDQRMGASARALEGVRAHQAVQSEYGPDDRAEVFLRDETTLEEVTFVTQGRADGVLQGDEGRLVVDEIKSTGRSLEEMTGALSDLHWAQGMCYAHFLAKEHDLDAVDVQLTYYRIDSAEIRRFSRSFTAAELEDFFLDALGRYLVFTRKRLTHQARRQESLVRLSFPFAAYRRGQRELAEAVYSSVLRRHHLFVEAPTGIGKTMSTLFPMLKAMGEGQLDALFYLTARSTAKTVAKKALGTLQKRGLVVLAVDITAKEKICLNDRVACNPVDCPYARGHYDRVNAVLLALLDHADILDADTLRDLAEEHRVCPFELTLDIAVFADVIIGDYNYAFHPQTKLRRFFDATVRPYGFLIDEAHNLVDRGRDMHTTELAGAAFDEAVGILDDPKYKTAVRSLFRVMRGMDSVYTRGDEERFALPDGVEELYFPLRGAMKALEVFLLEEQKHERYDAILELYFSMHAFVRLLDVYGEGFTTVVDREVGLLKILCLDPSRVLRESLLAARSAVLFSATLTPLSYYKRMLGGGDESFVLRLPSPFDPARLFIAVQDTVSTRYRHREASVGSIVRHLEALTRARPGNYLLFFPSYAYLRMAAEAYRAEIGETVLVQEGGATEEERERFLGNFRKNGRVTGFAVLGGVFAEGIDLIGERLIGAAIVSVGIPGISFERDLLRDYFAATDGLGYEYAYLIPGLNKALQAAGRIIRTEEDKGVLLLLDDRYGKPPYPELLPPHWSERTRVTDETALADQLNAFWKEEKSAED